MKKHVCVWEIFVPTKANGKYIPIAYHRKWDNKVKEISGGLTIYKTVKGIWENPMGMHFKDKMIPVRIVCTKQQFNSIIKLTALHYSAEEAILGWKISDEIILHNNPNWRESRGE